MHDPTDDKIQELVRAVLEAVDARLDRVRHEMAQFAADLEQQHHHVLSLIAAVERRVDAMGSPAPASPRSEQEVNDRMEQTAQVLIERMEVAQRASMATTEQRLTQLDAQIEELRRVAVPLTTAIQPQPGVAPPITGQLPRFTDADLAHISGPLVVAGRITNQIPVMPDPSSLQQATPPIDEINIDELTSLLSEKLGRLSLPPRPE